ncbi:hypothetical protein IWW34DRAFT_707063 [Fusarium oxysporum f. sp. albedinis]|nr:hypothetical protein IWW34DRAFT_707063 [Fusarium oxysporum f. sp. albedinis]KAK2469893.1 hypothetical protein H9L39_18708 [Fusarium oxysporum f. sp. albedinis]
MAGTRRPVHLNLSRDGQSPTASTNGAADTPIELVEKFHQQLAGHKATCLTPLNHIAQEFGIGTLLLKNETCRFGFPSAQLLGASWATFRAITAHLSLPLTSDIANINQAVAAQPLTLLVASDDEFSRAVIHTGRLLAVQVRVYLPGAAWPAVISHLRSEGAEVITGYDTDDKALKAAQEAAKRTTNEILISAVAGVGHSSDIPQWIVEGYSTMLRELDSQAATAQHGNPGLIVAPVGTGFLIEAVVRHQQNQRTGTAVLTVEPDTSACFFKSMQKGAFVRPTPKATPMLVAKPERDLLAKVAWPLLKSGVAASATVSDFEAHEAVLALQKEGISTGLVGASPVAALHRLGPRERKALGLGRDSVVVVLCTKGMQEYKTPRSVSYDEPISLAQTLVQINSASPSISLLPGPGETEIARYLVEWFEHRDIETHWIELNVGRPSVVAVVRGTGGGKSLMLNGHLDTVTLESYDDDPLSGKIADGKLYGRGSADMKSGVAAAMIALANSKKLCLKGDVIMAAVADEEGESIGTEDVLKMGWRADAAIVGEPTNLEILYTHKGFALFEVNIYGVASHGSRPDLGVDAICKAGYFLVELDRFAQQLSKSKGHAQVGPGNIHGSIIKGGEENSSYPARCSIIIERRTVAGETPAMIEQDLRNLLEMASEAASGIKYDLKVSFYRPPFELSLDHPFLSLVKAVVGGTLGHEPRVTGAPYWTDSALLADAGIPSLIWGPIGYSLHAREEYVDVDSINKVAQALTELTSRFCN